MTSLLASLSYSLKMVFRTDFSFVLALLLSNFSFLLNTCLLGRNNNEQTLLLPINTPQHRGPCLLASVLFSEQHD